MPGKPLQVLRADESKVVEDGELSFETAAALSRVFRWEELNETTLDRIRTGEERDAEKLARWQGQILMKIRKMSEELERFQDERWESEQSAIIERLLHSG